MSDTRTSLGIADDGSETFEIKDASGNVIGFETTYPDPE
jgi:hypothetical protein